jgi:hypothetical protein
MGSGKEIGAYRASYAVGYGVTGEQEGAIGMTTKAEEWRQRVRNTAADVPRFERTSGSGRIRFKAEAGVDGSLFVEITEDGATKIGDLADVRRVRLDDRILAAFGLWLVETFSESANDEAAR